MVPELKAEDADFFLEEMMNKLATALVLGVWIPVHADCSLRLQRAASSTAESAGIDQDVELLRYVSGSREKADHFRKYEIERHPSRIILASLSTTHTHANREARLRSYALVKEYAQSFLVNMTDAEAESLVEKMATFQMQTATLRQDWIPKFRKVFTGKQNGFVFSTRPAHQPPASSAVCRKYSGCRVVGNWLLQTAVGNS